MKKNNFPQYGLLKQHNFLSGKGRLPNWELFVPKIKAFPKYFGMLLFILLFGAVQANANTVAFNLSNLVAPSAGNLPATSGRTADGLASWTAEWFLQSDPLTVNPYEGNFEPSTQYKVRLKITSDNYTANPLPAQATNPDVTIDGKVYSTGISEGVYTLTGEVGEIILVFPVTETTVPKYTGANIKLIGPQAGKAASDAKVNVSSVTGLNDITNGTVTWSTSGTFQPATSYVATFTLTAAPTYTLVGIKDGWFNVTLASGGTVGIEKTEYIAGSKQIKVTFKPTETKISTDLTTYGLKLPKEGEEPVKKLTGTGIDDVNITWTEDGGSLSGTKFGLGKEYKTTFAISAKATHTLYGIAQNGFSLSGAKVTNAANTGNVTVTFKTAETIDIKKTGTGFSTLADWEKALTDAQPVAGGKPLTAADVKVTNPTFTVGKLEWKTGTELVGANYKANTVYDAYLTLKPGTNYTAYGLDQSIDFPLAGHNVKFVEAKDGNAIFKVSGYKATAKNPSQGDAFGITKPVAGDIALENVILKYSSYKVDTIAWSPDLSDDGKFLPATPYTATFEIELTTGQHTLFGMVPEFYTIVDAETTSLKVDEDNPLKGTITAVFTETAATITPEFVVTRPQADSIPQATIEDTEEYTATISWAEGIVGGSQAFSGKFKTGKEYIAKITVTPTSGYTLYDIKANTFSIKGVDDKYIVNKIYTPTSPITNPGVFWVRFAATDSTIEIAAGPSTIKEWEDSLKAAKPVAGMKAKTLVEVQALNNRTFTISKLEWKTDIYGADLDDKGNFSADSVYKAYLTLEPKNGYTTLGVGPLGGTFSIAGADLGYDNITIEEVAPGYAVFSAKYAKTDRNPSNATVFSIAAPVAGEVPVKDVTLGSSYTASAIVWKDAETGEPVGDEFAPNTVYVASFDIALTLGGVTLYGLDADFYEFGDGATSELIVNGTDRTKGKLTVTFPSTAKTIPLNFAIAKPVAGETPQATVIAPDEEYTTSSVKWYKNATGGTALASSAKFEADQIYRVEFTVNVNPGYTLYGAKAEDVIAAGDNVTDAKIATKKFTLIFGSTDKTIVINKDKPISAYPTENQEAPGAIEDVDYTGVITWTYEGNDYEIKTLPVGEPFVLGQKYTAKIVLTPKEGFTLYGLNLSGNIDAVQYDVFDRPTAKEVIHTAYSAEVTINYELTLAAPKPVYLANAIKLTKLPAAGNTIASIGTTASTINDASSQVLYVNAGSFLSWIPNENATGGKFLADKEYYVTVVVKAKPGYTLDGVTENFFEVAGAKRTEHAPGTGTTETLTVKVFVETGTLITEKVLAIAAPKAGEKPQAKLEATGELQEVDITWYEADGKTPAELSEIEGEFFFKAAHNYVAKVSVNPQTEFTLFGLPSNFFEVEGATTKNSAVTSGATSIATTITFATTGVFVTNLNVEIAAPVAGEEPPTTVDNDQWTATVEWSPAIPADGKFAVNTIYTAKVTFETKDGYTLFEFPDWGTFKVNGEEPTSAVVGEITKEFPRTAKLAGKPVAIGDGFVPTLGATLPETGKVFTISGVKINGPVTWTPELIPGKPFEFGTNYTVSAKIAPSSAGYTFYGLTEDYFTVNLADATVTYNVTDSIITITFPALAMTINILSIPEVEVPVVGGEPVRNFETDEYTVKVTWTAERDGVKETFSGATFQYGIVYTAKIVITPKAGYTVFGLGKDVFKLEKDGTVTCKNSKPNVTTTSVTVTVEFPAANYPTGINTLQVNDLTVVSIDGMLKIKGLAIGESVSVYTVQGVLVSRGVAISSEQEISLPSGIYIVVAGEKKVKALHK
jgi:hypothetical protein